MTRQIFLFIFLGFLLNFTDFAEAKILFGNSVISPEDQKKLDNGTFGKVLRLDFIASDAPNANPIFDSAEEALENSQNFHTDTEEAYRILTLEENENKLLAARAATTIANEEKKDSSAVWTDAITLQVDTLKQMNMQVDKAQSTFKNSELELHKRVELYQADIRQLQVLYNANKNNPMVLEAIERRIQTLMERMNTVLTPLKQALADSEGMLISLKEMRSSIPIDQQVSTWDLPDDIQEFVDTVDELTWRLNTLIAQINSQIAPAERVISALKELAHKIVVSLPNLWKSYYLSAPSSIFQLNLWLDIADSLTASFNNLKLRLSVEFPQDLATFLSLFLRAFSIFFFIAVGTYVLYRRFFKHYEKKEIADVFLKHLGFIIGGVAILSLAFGPQGEMYRVLVVLAIFSAVWGIYGLARSLRCLDIGEEVPHFFKNSLIFSLFSIALLYPGLPSVFLNSLWFVSLLCFVLYKKRYIIKYANEDLGFEKIILGLESPILWIALFICLFGWAKLAILIYTSFIALTIAVQGCYAALRLMDKTNTQKHSEGEGVQTIISGLATAVIVPIIIIIATLSFAIWFLAFPGGLQLIQYYINTGVNIGFASLNVLQLLLVLSAFYITKTLNSLGNTLISRMQTKGVSLDKTLIQPFKTAYSYVLWILFGLFVLKSLGVSLGSITVIAGGLSVGIGFGMQAIVNNFISGMILIFSRALQEGDVIEVNNIMGVVKRISVRATMVETYDSAVILVPNSEFISHQLINWTHANKHVRRDIKIGVAYGSDTEKVSQILLSIAKKHKDVLSHPPPSVFFMDFGPSSLDFTLRIWIKDIDIGLSVMSLIRSNIDKEFREANISIAFPQLDVHLKQDSN